MIERIETKRAFGTSESVDDILVTLQLKVNEIIDVINNKRFG